MNASSFRDEVLRTAHKYGSQCFRVNYPETQVFIRTSDRRKVSKNAGKQGN